MIEIIKMNEDNYKSVANIAAVCLKEAWSEKTYHEQLSNPVDSTFLALWDGAPAGFLSVWYVAGEIEINNIAVLSEYRRRGIADKLLDHALTQFHDAQAAFLEVRQSNLAAIRLYDKHGFIKVGVRKNFYRDPPEDAILMNKTINR